MEGLSCIFEACSRIPILGRKQQISFELLKVLIPKPFFFVIILIFRAKFLISIIFSF